MTSRPRDASSDRNPVAARPDMSYELNIISGRESIQTTQKLNHNLRLLLDVYGEIQLHVQLIDDCQYQCLQSGQNETLIYSDIIFKLMLDH